MSLTTVIFDLFGTLVYLQEEAKPYLKLFTELGLDSQQMRRARHIAMTENLAPLDAFVKAIAPHASIDLRTYEEDIGQEIGSARLYPEAMPVLERLGEEGYRIGLISNLATPYKKVFFDLGLHNHIDTYLFSCDEGCKKPDPEIYNLLLWRMYVDASEALMVGDKMHADVLGPRGVGMDAVLLDRSEKDPRSIHSLDGVFDYL